MMYDIILFKNLGFRPFTRKREVGVYKNLHSGKRFWKDAFSVTVFTGYVWTVGQTRGKISVFKQKGIHVDEGLIWLFGWMCEEVVIITVKVTSVSSVGVINHNATEITMAKDG